jgi:hypothetical protein
MQNFYLPGIHTTGQRLRTISRLFAQSLLLLSILCALSQIAYTATDFQYCPQAGLRNSNGSRRLSAMQLQRALESLRHKTGFLELRFDESGFLTLGDRTRFVGGSATARELLIATVDGRVAIELEAHDYSSHIAFAHITAGTAYTNFQTKARIEARQVQLDFSDFAELRGEREVIAAFDLGFAILHELVHGVWGLRDAVGKMNELGACDEQINRMRRELNLPERQGYSAGAQAVLSNPAGATKRAELVFARERMESGRARTERFYLRWDAKRVASATQAKHSTL